MATERAGAILSSGLAAAMEDALFQARQFGHFIADELRPFPGRDWAAIRLVTAAVITVIVSETLRIPFPAFSAYLIFFVASDDGVSSIKLGVAAMLGVTVALAASMVMSICFMDVPWFRLPVTLCLIAGAIWLSRTLVLAVMGRLLAVILALYLSLADSIFEPETLTESTLWLWSVAGVAIGITILVNLVFALVRPTASPLRKNELPKGFLVPDALGNPEYAQFTAKTLLAIVACEVFMNAVAWPGIRTSMITCVVTALANLQARRQKQSLRFLGAGLGGLAGLAAIIFLVPHMDSIVGLSLLVAVATFLFAWVAVGSQRISYAGFQMALAFYIMLLPGFDTSIDLTSIRDRFVGIIVGITAMWIFFDHLGPSSPSTAQA
jgi:hypothetical protein